MIEKIQQALRSSGIDSWLFFDYHRRDPLAYRILGLNGQSMATRRWYYLIPASGEPGKLVHRIEAGALSSLPGRESRYSSWVEQRTGLRDMLAGHSKAAMQYSPYCAIPYVSLVDAGTVELVRSLGVEVVSSSALVQEFEAKLTEVQFEQHVRAGNLVDKIREQAFGLISHRVRSGISITEFEVQQFVLENFRKAGLTTDHGPVVAVNSNASDPHYEPVADRASEISHGDFVLIDLWAKLNEHTSIFYDITWVGFCGREVPSPIQNVFEIVRNARKKACRFVIDSVSEGRAIAGYEVDDQARGYIASMGFGENFFHRTGHSIGTEVHGTGANMDNLESHDDRPIIPGTCFSVEPGVYLSNFGIRSEVNVWVSEGSACVTGEAQEDLLLL